MQMSALGGLRGQMIAELKVLAPLLAIAEDRYRTILERVDAEIGEPVVRKRPIEDIARKIKANPKFPEKYATYITRLANLIHVLASPIHLEKVKEFQRTYSSSILPEALRLEFVERSKERVEKLALIAADNCLAHNRRIEKLSKKMHLLNEERGHQLHEPPSDCQPCKTYRDRKIILDCHLRDCKRAEVTARNLWIETSELKTQEKSTAETITCWIIGGLGGAAFGLAVNAVGNSELTIGSMQAGAQAGPSVVTTAKGIVTGDPQIVNQGVNSKFQFRSLGLRVHYAFQPQSSGLVGYYIWNALKSHPSHTVGIIVIRVDGNEGVMLFFNAKAFFPVEPMVYWQLCQKLWQQVNDNKMPPQECLDILQQLENGLLQPENGYPAIRGVVDERLAFCTDRLKRHCEALKSAIKEEPKSPQVPERNPDYSLGRVE